MGGKNAGIVTAGADLERAADRHRAQRVRHGRAEMLGVVAAVRAGVGGGRADRARRATKVAALGVGDPTRAENWLGPVVSEKAQRNYLSATSSGCAVAAPASGSAATRCCEGDAGARLLRAADARRGAARRSAVARGDVPADRDAAAGHATSTKASRSRTIPTSGSPRASTARRPKSSGFFEDIEAGVAYANRPQGATTGAWPGYQPFGGWKGSGNTGKAIASFYYLAQYMREQSQTVVE